MIRYFDRTIASQKQVDLLLIEIIKLTCFFIAIKVQSLETFNNPFSLMKVILSQPKILYKSASMKKL